MCHEKERQRLHTYLSISKYIFHGLVQNQLRGGLYLGNGVGTKRNSANRGVIKQWRKNLNFFFFFLFWRKKSIISKDIAETVSLRTMKKKVRKAGKTSEIQFGTM